MQSESTEIKDQKHHSDAEPAIETDDKKSAARSERRRASEESEEDGSADSKSSGDKKDDKKKGSGMKKYPPTPEELREWMDRKGLSNKDVAKALRLSDGRVVRFWTSKKDPRPIPYPSWYTLRHKFGK